MNGKLNPIDTILDLEQPSQAKPSQDILLPKI